MLLRLIIGCLQMKTKSPFGNCVGIVAALIGDDGEITSALEEPSHKQPIRRAMSATLAHANQLYDKVKRLAETERTLGEIDARFGLLKYFSSGYLTASCKA